MTRRYTLRFDMLSDEHVGRPGSVDWLLLRDADGQPYLPAKTIRGVWRDAAERVAVALGGGWPAVVDVIFGDEPAQNRSAAVDRPRSIGRGRPVLLVTPARLPAALRRGLAASAELRAAVAFVKPGVMIDPVSGRAADQFLRFEEVARAGAVLTATATFDLADAAEALLLASTRLVTRVGGKRRRGNGRCALTVPDADVPAAIEKLAGAAPAVVAAMPAAAPAAAGPAADPGWVEYPFALRLVGPVAVARRTVGNVVKSLDFIPGTYLLPLLTRAYPALRAAVARGEAVVTHATREVGGVAGRPTPFALFAPKGEGFVAAVSAFVGSVDGLKQQRKGYVGPGENSRPAAGAMPTTVQTHNVIDDRVQRPTADVGGVYSYEALEPGVFRGAVVVRKGLLPKDAPAVLTAAGAAVRLGSSKKDDYGRAALTVFDAVEPQEPAVRDGELDVWLLSDVLLRGASLRPEPTVAALGRELAARLGVGLTEPKAFARQRRTESWHTGWARPRPSLVGLEAGTCVRFAVSGALTADVLAAAAGVGERTAEGYGRVAFNHPLLTTPPTGWTNAGFPEPAGEVPPAPVAADADADAAADFARVVVEAAWKDAIRTAALHATDTPAKREALFGWTIPQPRASRPTLSQLGGLRAALPGLRGPADGPAVAGWLDAVRANKRRADKWPAGALARTGRWFTDAAAVWTTLRDQRVAFPTLPAVDPRALEARLWAFAVLALVQAGVRAHKRDTEPREEAARGA